MNLRPTLTRIRSAVSAWIVAGFVASWPMAGQQLVTDPRVSLDLDRASAVEVLSHLASLLQLELDAPDDARCNVTTELVAVRTSTALRVVCDTAGCEWRVRDGRLEIVWLPNDGSTAGRAEAGTPGAAPAARQLTIAGAGTESRAWLGQLSADWRRNFERRINLNATDRPLADVLRIFARSLEVDLVVDPGVDQPLTVQLNEVPHWQALEQIAAVHLLDVVLEPEARLLRVGPRGSESGLWPFAVELPPSTREKLLEPVTISLEAAVLREVFAVFARMLEVEVVVDPAVDGLTTIELQAVPAHRALDQLCASHGCRIERSPADGLLIVPR